MLTINSIFRRLPGKMLFVLCALLITQFAFGKDLIYSDSAHIIIDRNSVQKSTTLFWLTLGGGFILPNLLGGDIKATYAWDENSISAKISGGSQLAIFAPPPNEIVEYGIYYGRLANSEFLLGRIAAGISYFTGSRERQVTNGGTFTTSISDIHEFGAGIEAEGMLKYKYIGISLMLEVIASPNFIFGGVMINFSIGKLD